MFVYKTVYSNFPAQHAWDWYHDYSSSPYSLWLSQPYRIWLSLSHLGWQRVHPSSFSLTCILLPLTSHLLENHAGLTFKMCLPCHHLVIPHKTITYVWGIMIFSWITAIAIKNFSVFLFLILYNLFSTKWSTSLWCEGVKSIPVLKTLQWFYMSHRVKTKAYGLKFLHDLVSKYLLVLFTTSLFSQLYHTGLLALSQTCQSCL